MAATFSAKQRVGAELVLVERYPDWENRRTLWHSARSVIKRKDG